MRRRDFIVALSRAAAAWPLAARAQQPQRVRRIAIISMTGPNDRGGTFLAAFEDELTRLGWTPGRDLEIDRRWNALDPEIRERHAREVVAFKPEVIFAVTPVVVTALLRETQTIPIVFVDGPEKAIGSYIIERSRPRGNVTGFIPLVTRSGPEQLRIAAVHTDL